MCARGRARFTNQPLTRPPSLPSHAPPLAPPPPPPPPPLSLLPQGSDLESADLGSLTMAGFLTLLINLAFYRENPRYTPQLEGAPKLTQTTVPLLQCVKNLVNDNLPKMRTGDTASFRLVRTPALRVLRLRASHSPRLSPPLRLGPSLLARGPVACMPCGMRLAWLSQRRNGRRPH